MVTQSAIAITLKLQWCLHIVGITLCTQELTSLAVQAHQEEVSMVETGKCKARQIVLHIGMEIPTELLLQTLG